MNTTGDNVVDFFTRRKVNDLHRPNTDANDKNAADFGRYVGVLPKGDAIAIQDTIAQLGRKRAQIEALTEEYIKMHDMYSYMLGGALALLGSPLEEYNPEFNEMYVDSAGHCWIIDTRKTQST